MQIRSVGFEEFGRRAMAVDLDRILASKAITEGEASLIEDLSALGMFGADEGDVAWTAVFDSWQYRARRAAVASRLPVSLAWGHFPYPFGTPYVHAAYRREGFAGVERLYREPPASTAQVLAGLGARETTGLPWSEPMGADVLPVLPERLAPIGADRLGAWVLGVFLERLLGAPADATRASLLAAAPTALRADSFTFFSDMTTDETAACWRLRFTSADVALALLAEIRGAARPTWIAWVDDRDLVILASANAQTRALGGPQLAFRSLTPEAAAVLVPSPSAAAAPRCARRLEGE